MLKLKKKKALETAENKQKDEKLLGGSKVLVYFDVKHVFTAAAKGSIRETQLTGRVSREIHTFVATKDVFYRDKHVFVATEL